jgi:hypothetical protein
MNSTRSLVKIDGENNKTFNNFKEGKLYFAIRRKQAKGTGVLMALYKEVNGKWRGVEQN